MGKASKRCWFSKLTDAQLVALAQAVGIAAAPGATHTLVARLHANALAAPYGKTYLSPIGTTSDDGGWYFELATDRDGGLSMDDLKQRCRERKLSPTGNRFKLVLALLQHDGARARAAAEAPARRVRTAQGTPLRGRSRTDGT